MRDAGVAIGSNIEEYGDAQDYLAIVRRRADNGEIPAYYYPLPIGVLDDVQSLVNPALLRKLNNKHAFAEHVGPDCWPPRQILVSPSSEAILSLSLPIVLKVATDALNAGGEGVMVCRKKTHLERAAKRFVNVPKLIAEQYVDADGNWATQCAVAPDGTVEYLGATQQVTMRSGVFAGNLYESKRNVPDGVAALARATAEVGAALGFRGICGFDILNRGGRSYLIDPNFRPTWSTAFAFQSRQRMDERKEYCARCVVTRMPASLDRFLARCRKGLDAGWLVPLTTFDPVRGGFEGDNSLIIFMILGHDRRQVEAREGRLRRMGAEFTAMRDVSAKTTVGKILRKASRDFWRIR